MIDAAVGGGVSQIQTLVEKMPEVAEVCIITQSLFVSFYAFQYSNLKMYFSLSLF